MAIETDDLVMIVHECDGLRRLGLSCLGSIFTVKRIEHMPLPCIACGGDHTGLFAIADQEFANGGIQAPVSWLKKIPPLSELEGKERERELVK
jgi:hypothetical protein